ncbi:hypothetical protein RIF29_22941 [Crotalaria pallida]|uniref:Protein-serine/threonine phosphatase n=1 Tax=Crotalaria pallida TaxID=3830 RepID=A0AAN9F5L3_CROPI
MVSGKLRRIMSPCWRPFDEGEGSNAESSGRFVGLLWHKDLGKHQSGEFSMAVVQANNLLEDHSQLESGPMSSAAANPQGTFVGIYDGHGGPEAARFVNDHLFKNITKFTSENQGLSADVINKAFVATEEEFLSLVKKQWQHKPQIASVGSCVLVGVICSGQLYIANAGDSRAVLGQRDVATKEIKAVQLSYEHNASLESVREELRSLHPDDPQIVVMKHTVWRVKGLIQVSRSIGDAYLKKAEFNKAPLLAKFRLPEPFEKPILKAEPTILEKKLHPEDQFLIFASDGLWEHVSNETAVDIVHNSPRNGVARKLIKTALCEAAKKREMRYSDLQKIDRGVRRHFHDDITVIVLFLNSHLISRCISRGPIVSIKGGSGVGVELEAVALLAMAIPNNQVLSGGLSARLELSIFSATTKHNAIKFSTTYFQLGHSLQLQLPPVKTKTRLRGVSLNVPRAMAIFGVQEVLPPPLTSTSSPPSLFDGTTRLYISYRCPYAQRVWITRNCKGLQDKIELVPIDLQDRPSWYKEQVYPSNKVPSLEHNNEVRGESLDLIKYIDTHFEGPSLFPSDGPAKEFAEELLSYTDTFYKTVVSSFKGDATEAGTAFDYIETALSKYDDGPFFLGQFSLVDIAYAPFIERFQPFLIDVKNYDIKLGRPKLAAWIEGLNNIDGYKITRSDPKELVESYKKRFLVA